MEDQISINTKNMIPKIIHYCWFGRSPLPELAVKCIESWKKFLPNYEIKEWNEDNFNVNIVQYTAEAYRAKKYAFVSDYARFWILHKYGGLYFDTDVEVIKNMDDIIANGAFMGCELCPDKVNGRLKPAIAPGLGLGVEPGNKLYKQIIDSYKNKHLFNKKGLITETVVGIVTKILINNKKGVNLKQICKIGEITIYPDDYFCPIIAYTGEMNITENTRSIHHYTATWVDKKQIPRYKRAIQRFKYIIDRIFVTIFYKKNKE